MFRVNETKRLLAKDISARCPYLLTIVYTGNPAQYYLNGTMVYSGNKDKCISHILDELKSGAQLSNGKFTFTYQNQSILIIAKNMADRAQTFKSKDRQWILTHMFIDLGNTVTVDTAIQCLRGNGQYEPNQPVMRLYSSQDTRDILHLAQFNNTTITMNLKGENINGLRLKQHLRDLHFARTNSFKSIFVGRGLPGLPLDHPHKHIHGYTSDENLCITMAQNLAVENKCTGYNIVTKMIKIPIAEYREFLQRHPEAAQQFETTRPFEGLSDTTQRSLRKWIIERVYQYNYWLGEEFSIDRNKECQVGYTEERCKDLNMINHKKLDNYRARVIAVNPKNKECIPVVIYSKDYYDNPTKYENRVLIWHGTDNVFKLHAYVSGKVVYYVKPC